MKKCANKTIFITGASSGIGAACAEVFAKQGARLILAARRKEKLLVLSQHLQATYNVEIHVLPLDVSQRVEVEQAINSLPKEWKNIDVLINSAGLALGREAFQATTSEAIETMINTNVIGLLLVTRAILPLMLEQNSGHVFNIGSTAAREAYAGGSVYCATKAAVRMFSAALKKDLHGTPLRVTEIDPGMTETEFSMVRFKGDQGLADKVYEGMIPLTGQDIAEAILFCATRPPHVNIGEMLLYPTDQSGITMVHRRN